MRPARLAPLLALVLAVAGCGGGGEDGMSAEDYRWELDSACEHLAEANARIPARVRDEGLDTDGARALAERAGREFERTLRGLRPPEELRDAHERLLAIGEDPPDAETVDDLRAWTLRFADVYADLGADGCERVQRASARALADAPAP